MTKGREVFGVIASIYNPLTPSLWEVSVAEQSCSKHSQDAKARGKERDRYPFSPLKSVCPLIQRPPIRLHLLNALPFPRVPSLKINPVKQESQRRGGRADINLSKTFLPLRLREGCHWLLLTQTVTSRVSHREWSLSPCAPAHLA